MRRDMARLQFIKNQITEVERERLCRLEEAHPQRSQADGMVRTLSRAVGLGVETADMLVHEILARDLPDR
jgi:transposase